MLYTIIPFEQVFQDVDKVTAPKELQYLGQRVLALPLPEPGQFRIVQLISTDPTLFLRPEWQPGTVISFPAVATENA
jgi:hypothetical protein